MKIIENLFGEFVDCLLGIDPSTVLVPYKLFAGHSIGFWLFMFIIVFGSIFILCNKKAFKKFF